MLDRDGLGNSRHSAAGGNETREVSMTAWFKQEAGGRITTPCLFLDGEVIELHLENDTLSDRGAAYDAVRTQTAHCTFPSGFLNQQATEVSTSLGVRYDRGVFSTDVTEENLDLAVLRLMNAMLQFYGLMLGVSRILTGKE